jgi:hypothetical protein
MSACSAVLPAVLVEGPAQPAANKERPMTTAVEAAIIGLCSVCIGTSSSSMRSGITGRQHCRRRTKLSEVPRLCRGPHRGLTCTTVGMNLRSPPREGDSRMKVYHSLSHMRRDCKKIPRSVYTEAKEQADFRSAASAVVGDIPRAWRKKRGPSLYRQPRGRGRAVRADEVWNLHPPPWAAHIAPLRRSPNKPPALPGVI